MACMKCGKDTEETQLFCARCLEVMEAYPVKPDTHIQLPVRDEEIIPKKQTHKIRTKDGQIATLRLQLRLMWAVVAVLLLGVAVLLSRSGLLPG